MPRKRFLSWRTRQRTRSRLKHINVIIIFLQDILLNDDIKLDWTFRMSFASDIARVSQQVH